VEDARNPFKEPGPGANHLLYQGFLEIAQQTLGSGFSQGTLVGLVKMEQKDPGKRLAIRDEKGWRDFLMLCHVNKLERCEFVVTHG
jgi:hypothetical protein